MATMDIPRTAPGVVHIPRLDPGARFWARHREPIAGALIIIGICWPFLFSSISAIPWWFFPPFAIIGGFMRWKSYPRTSGAFIPLWAFFLVIICFASYGYAFEPMNQYGQEKLLHLVLLGGAAYLGASRQRPLTGGLVRGMRSALWVTLFLAICIGYKNRDLFMYAEDYGMDRLRSTFSVTGFPLVLALGAACLVPRKLLPVGLFVSAAAILGTAVMEIFVRGRFDAMMLCLLAALVVVGPPWKYLIVRLPLAFLLLALGLSIYTNVLPKLGDSFLYLSWMNPETIGGRSELYQEAIKGFMNYPMGQGIGSFQQVEPFLSYPHNVLLESAYEIGLCGLLCLLAIYALVFHRVYQFWLSPPHRVLAVLLLFVFCQMLKAGDIAMLAFQWIYLYLLLVATPLAPSWRLLRGHEVI